MQVNRGGTRRAQAHKIQAYRVGTLGTRSKRLGLRTAPRSHVQGGDGNTQTCVTRGGPRGEGAGGVGIEDLWGHQRTVVSTCPREGHSSELNDRAAAPYQKMGLNFSSVMSGFSL